MQQIFDFWISGSFRIAVLFLCSLSNFTILSQCRKLYIPNSLAPEKPSGR